MPSRMVEGSTLLPVVLAVQAEAAAQGAEAAPQAAPEEETAEAAPADEAEPAATATEEAAPAEAESAPPKEAATTESAEQVPPESAGEPDAAQAVVDESQQPLPLQEGFVPFFKPDVILGSLITTDKPLVRLLRRIAREHQLKLFVDSNIDIEVSLSLANPRSSLNQLLNVLIHLYPIRCERIGEFVYVHPLRHENHPRNMVLFDPAENHLAFELEGMGLDRFIRDLMEVAGVNIRIQESFVDRQTVLSGYQTWLPFEKALSGLLAPYGYGIRERDGVLHIGRIQGITIRDDLIDIWYESTPIETILRELSEKGNYPIMFLDRLEGEVSLDIRGVALENLLDLLLSDARYSYRKQGDVHLIGQGDTASYYDTAIIRYEEAHASLILDLLPELPEHFTEGIKVILLKEHNSLMITGEPQRVDSLAEVLRALDRPVAQVLLEVLVVQYNVEDTFELGLKLNAGDGQELFPNIQNLTFTGFRDNHGSYRIARLPSDFTVKLNALQQKGKVRVITKPHVATLSGNEAALVIGTTLSYKVASEELVGNDNPRVRTTEAIQTVDANTNLTITPWVMGDDLLTVDIHSEFNTFDGAVVDNVPPAQNISMLKSKVRLRDGETIILGGLIVDSQSLDREGVPLLSKIPVLGALFRNRKKVTKLNERVIYITPHIYYGHEDSTEFVKDSSELDYRLRSDWEEWRRRRAERREKKVAKRKREQPSEPVIEKPVQVPENPTDLPKFLSGEQGSAAGDKPSRAFSPEEEQPQKDQPTETEEKRLAPSGPFQGNTSLRTLPHWDDEDSPSETTAIHTSIAAVQTVPREPEPPLTAQHGLSPDPAKQGRGQVAPTSNVAAHVHEPSKPLFAAELVPVQAHAPLAMPASLLPQRLGLREPRRRLRKPQAVRGPKLTRPESLADSTRLVVEQPLVEDRERPLARQHRSAPPRAHVSVSAKPTVPTAGPLNVSSAQSPPRQVSRPSTEPLEPEVPQPVSPPNEAEPHTGAEPNDVYEALTRRLADAMFQPEQPYSIVFMAKCNRASLVQFLDRHPDRRIGVVPRRLKGQPCYLLTWGAFANRAQAERMRSQLPTQLKALGESPWIVNLHPNR